MFVGFIPCPIFPVVGFIAKIRVVVMYGYPEAWALRDHIIH